MSPEEIAARHPRLYRVTSPSAMSGILRLGLLPASRLLDLFEPTIHRPARRGLSTFTPLLRHDYAIWQRLRDKSTPDRIKEVTVVGGVDRIAGYLIEHYLVLSQGA